MQFLVLKLHNTTLFHAWEGKRGRVDIEKCDKYSEGMLRGLSHMHIHGLAHRDLVMLNLMLSFAGDTIEIGDFGMAHSAASFLLDRNVTQLHGRSPEVLLSAGSGVASCPANLPAPAYTMDLWGAGVVCFALYFAALPFVAASEDEAGVAASLQSMSDLLGSPASTWPDVTNLRLWSKFGPKLLPVTREDPRATLMDPKFTKRQLPEDHGAIIDVVLSLLRWDPNDRAQTALAAESLGARAAGVSAAARPEAGSVPAFAESGADAPPPSDGFCKCGGGCGTHACVARKVRKCRTGGAGPACAGLASFEGCDYCSACKRSVTRSEKTAGIRTGCRSWRPTRIGSTTPSWSLATSRPSTACSRRSWWQAQVVGGRDMVFKAQGPDRFEPGMDHMNLSEHGKEKCRKRNMAITQTPEHQQL